MSTPLSLECSRLIFDLIGFQETKKVWLYRNKMAYKKCSGKHHPISKHPEPFCCAESNELTNPQWSKRNSLQEFIENKKLFPAYNFAELIRIWILLGINRESNVVANREELKELVLFYAGAPTEPEGMKAVEEYLMKLLK